MTRFTVPLVTILLYFAFGSLLAYGQGATRTWVSGVGDDVNPCSRTAPCRTFAGAVSKTAQNGEIDALDPNGYGAFTIVKSLTVDGTGTLASILSGPGNGIVINIDAATTSDAVHTVRLRGLAITGAATNAKSGNRGIYILSSNVTDLKVYVENVVVDGLVNEGIYYGVNGGDLVIKNSTIRNNNKAGITVDSGGANIAYLRVEHSSIDLNLEGVRIEDNVRATITDSSASDNTLNGFTIFPNSMPSEMNIDNSTAAHNKQYGIIAISTGAYTGTVRISNMEITNNVVGGLQSYGGQICSNGRNRITAPTQAPNCAFTEQ
jgi:hypothetical protein